MNKFNEVYKQLIKESNKNVIKEDFNNDNDNENKTITDLKGRTVKIDSNLKYTVIYQDMYDKLIKVSQSCSHNYPQDDYIGHADEEGNSKGKNFYFDQTGFKNTPIFKVLTDEEFINILKNL